jgi:ABC-type transport system involved in Fe-S cluster assembly fused permease/ATPase subunit
MSYFLGNFSEMILEFGFVAVAMNFFAGPIYLFNMLLTMGIYSKFTKIIGAKRLKLIKERRELDRK